MFCPRCGSKVNDRETICPDCMCSIRKPNVRRFCTICGRERKKNEQRCSCGALFEVIQSAESSRPPIEKPGTLASAERPTKFCEKCGSKIDAEAVMCVHCGCMIGKATPTEKKKHTGRTVFLIFLFAIIAAGIGAFYMFYLLPNKYIDIVKKGTPSIAPGRTWGDAAEKALVSPEWKYEGGNEVSVTGKMYGETIKITFEINTSTNMFTATSAEVAGVKYTDAIDVGSIIIEIFNR